METQDERPIEITFCTSLNCFSRDWNRRMREDYGMTSIELKSYGEDVLAQLGNRCDVGELKQKDIDTAETIQTSKKERFVQINGVYPAILSGQRCIKRCLENKDMIAPAVAVRINGEAERINVESADELINYIRARLEQPASKK